MEKLISIVVPIYNVEKYLEKCIKSIMEQTYENIEIILVDDGSIDNSSQICDYWKEKEERISVIHKKNGGLSSARNSGIDMAKGEYIFFLDSDDYISKYTIEELYKNIEQANAEIAISNRYHVFENGKKKVKFKKEKESIIFSKEKAIFELNNFRYFDMSACGKLFKTELFKEVKFPVGKKSEDFFVMYKLFELSNRIIYNSEPYYYYYQRKGSITKSKSINTDFLDAAREQMNYIEKRHPNLKNCVRTAYVSANMTVYNMAVSNKSDIDIKLVKELKREVKNNYLYVKNNKALSRLKKFQTMLFIYNLNIYKMLYILFKYIERN